MESLEPRILMNYLLLALLFLALPFIYPAEKRMAGIRKLKEKAWNQFLFSPLLWAVLGSGSALALICAGFFVLFYGIDPTCFRVLEEFPDSLAIPWLMFYNAKKQKSLHAMGDKLTIEIVKKDYRIQMALWLIVVCGSMVVSGLRRGWVLM